MATKLTSKQRAIGSQKRANLATIKARQEAVQAVQASQSQQILTRRATIQSQSRNRRIAENVASKASSTVVKTATPSDNSNLIMTTIFTMAGLIIVYLIVTNPTNTQGLSSKLQNGLHAFSSDTPLFTVKSTGKSS